MKKLFLLLLAVVIFTPFQANSSSVPSAKAATSAVATAAEADLYSYFNDTHIEFYEKRVAKSPVVSQLSERRLVRIAADNGVNVDKIKKVLVLQHALQSQGKFYTAKEIISFSTAELIVLGIDYVKHLKATTPEKEFQQIVADFKKISDISF